AGRVERVVAGEAVVAPDEVRLADQRFLQRVEDDALRRILRRKLDEAAAHPANRDLIAEEQRPWIPRVDASGLNAVGVEDDDLRFERHLQRVEHRPQIARRPVAPERQSSVAYLP